MTMMKILINVSTYQMRMKTNFLGVGTTVVKQMSINHLMKIWKLQFNNPHKQTWLPNVNI
jgi:hypothetical protein